MALTDVRTRDTDLSYPYRFDRSHSSMQVRDQFASIAVGEESTEWVSVAGRVGSIRVHRRTVFFDLEDTAGTIQFHAKVGSDGSARLPATGDIVGVIGPVTRTRLGELSVAADVLTILAPSLRPMPDKRHGLEDPGLRRRQRHLDLIANEESRSRFLLRSRILRAIRETLWARGFVEVETAVLDRVYGGAEARPFTTACNALGRDLFLRISPELSLKRLVVGGLENVFELSKQFRNEGLDARHHPEFTSLEVYQAFADYNDMMTLCEDLISAAAREPRERTFALTLRDGTTATIDLTTPFRRVTMLQAIAERTGVDMRPLDDVEARRAVERLGLTVDPMTTADEVVLATFEEFVEPQLVQPTFVLDYPASLCPLTKRHRADPRLAERFELYVGGIEFANAYSELNDPAEQRRQFELQSARRQRGDETAHMPDWDFVEALEYGMPPTGGLGIGIDRLVMLLTGADHIQDVIAFPLVE